MTQSLIQNLQEKPYVQVPLTLSQAQLTEAMDAFFAFLELPDDVKNHIDMKLSPLHRRGDVGFKHRDPEDGPYSDSKDFFHYHPLILKEYDEFLKDQPVVRNFVEKAQPIWQMTYDILYSLMAQMEPTYPGCLGQIFDSERVHLLLRFLKYNWHTSTKYLAKPHFDAGSFTLAITESCPGLRIGTGPEDLESVDSEPGQGIFFVSSNYEKITRSPDFKPAWHDVIQTDETLIGKPFARWAMVAFLDGHNLTALDKTETHKFYSPEKVV